MLLNIKKRSVYAFGLESTFGEWKSQQNWPPHVVFVWSSKEIIAGISRPEKNSKVLCPVTSGHFCCFCRVDLLQSSWSDYLRLGICVGNAVFGFHEIYANSSSTTLLQFTRKCTKFHSVTIDQIIISFWLRSCRIATTVADVEQPLVRCCWSSRRHRCFWCCGVNSDCKDPKWHSWISHCI